MARRKKESQSVHRKNIAMVAEQLFMKKGIENREIRSNIEILPTIFSFWGMLSGVILLAANKEEYITQHLKKSKKEFLLYGFDMLYNSLAVEGRG